MLVILISFKSFQVNVGIINKEECLLNIPTKFFKSIEGVKGLFEIRVEYESNIYRIFCCFDKGNLVVLFNGFQKKTQKTPTKELNKAEKIMEEYFNEQKENKNGNKK